METYFTLLIHFVKTCQTSVTSPQAVDRICINFCFFLLLLLLLLLLVVVVVVVVYFYCTRCTGVQLYV